MPAPEPTPPHEVAMLLEQARVIDRALRRNLDGISHDQSLIAPRPAGNALNWVVGHLVHGRQGFLPSLGREPVLDRDALARYARGSAPIDDHAQAWRLDALMDAWIRSAERFDEGLRALGADDLRRPIDPSGGDAGRTLGLDVSFLLFHEAYHVGQTGVLRRIAGEEGAIR